MHKAILFRTRRNTRLQIKRPLYIVVPLALTLLVPARAEGTWSILVADSRTREVALGMATCVNGLDLLAVAPVVVVGKGVAVAQSFVDVDGMRRATLFDGLVNGIAPQDILVSLQVLPGHETRQYGIVDIFGRTAGFTGSSNGAFAANVVGSFGTLHYAIQGNLLTGPLVISAAEQALLTTPGDIPGKLMAAMRSARAAGGDGRCSCGPDPTACGSPPPSFTNSALNGGVVVARVGDTGDPLCDAAGCADGNYFMRFNVAGQTYPSVDPVHLLQTQFDSFRADHEGRPDAIRSTVEFRSGRNGTAVMSISLRDWRDLPITAAIGSLTVQHASESAGIASIGTVVDEGGGVFSVSLIPTLVTGVDRFVVTVDDGIRSVVLMPDPDLEYVRIDIRPGSESNPIVVRSRGLLPAAILGSAALDVTQVDPATIVLAGVDLAFRRSPGRPTPAYTFEDVNGDEYLDLVGFFEIEALTGAGALTGSVTALALSARLTGGRAIMGTDAVRLVGDCPREHCVGGAGGDSDLAAESKSRGGASALDNARNRMLSALVYPHPVRREAIIRYALQEAGRVRLSVFDLAGREVERLVDQSESAGWHEVRWDARAAEQVYLYRLEAIGETLTGRFIVLR